MSTETKTKAPKRAPKTTKDVQALLNYIQQNLNAPKNLYNRFGKYYYRSAEGILEAVKFLLPEGATLKLTDEIKGVAPYVYTESRAILFFKGETEEAVAQAGIELTKKGMDFSQVFGASSSYARKYALNGLFLIDDTKDADTDESRTESNAKSPTPLSSVTPKKSGKQVLKEGTPNFNKVKAYLTKNGKTEITKKNISGKYDISEEVFKKLGF